MPRSWACRAIASKAAADLPPWVRTRALSLGALAESSTAELLVCMSGPRGDRALSARGAQGRERPRAWLEPSFDDAGRARDPARDAPIGFPTAGYASADSPSLILLGEDDQ